MGVKAQWKLMEEELQCLRTHRLECANYENGVLWDELALPHQALPYEIPTLPVEYTT